jgi:hypothetical protein
MEFGQRYMIEEVNELFWYEKEETDVEKTIIVNFMVKGKLFQNFLIFDKTAKQWRRGRYVSGAPTKYVYLLTEIYRHYFLDEIISSKMQATKIKAA